MIISLLGNMFSEIQIFSRFTSPNMIYLTYFIWGRIVSEYLYEKKYSCYITIGFLLSIMGGFFDIFYQWESNSPWIFFTSIFLFANLLKTNPSPIFSRGIKFISSTSYGMYLSHFMLISLFLKLGFSSYVPIIINPIVMTLLVLFTEMAFMYVIKKMKLNHYLM